jgi:hypothetical protein
LSFLEKLESIAIAEEWIPAFAGMTPSVGCSGMTPFVGGVGMTPLAGCAGMIVLFVFALDEKSLLYICVEIYALTGFLELLNPIFI